MAAAAVELDCRCFLLKTIFKEKEFES